MHVLPAIRRALSLALLALSAACGRGDAAARWEGTVDTLANGAVLVKNTETGVWREGEAWTLAEEARIGSVDSEGPDLFGQVTALEADPLGRIYVLDGQAQEVRVFNPDGTHLRTIGRKGGGPGEFKQAIGMLWAPDGRLWVVDPSNARYSVIDTAGRYVSAHRRTIGGYAVPWRGGFDTEKRFYELGVVSGANGARRAAIRFDAAMAPADTAELPDYEGEVFEHRRERMYMAADVPFTPVMVLHLADDGTVWSGVSDRYRIHRHRLGGDTLRVVERAFRPLPVTAAERDTALRGLSWFTEQGGRVDGSRIPDTKPAYEGFFTDDQGSLWVRPATARADLNRVFDVFDAEGRYLGRVRSPFPLPRDPVFRGGKLYAVTTDELGVQYVVRMRVVKPE